MRRREKEKIYVHTQNLVKCCLYIHIQVWNGIQDDSIKNIFVFNGLNPFLMNFFVSSLIIALLFTIIMYNTLGVKYRNSLFSQFSYCCILFIFYSNIQLLLLK